MDVEFINPFLNSMSSVLTTMATLSINPGGASLKQDDLPPGDVTGIISMSSPQTRGTLAISFTKPVILEITKRMLGDELSEIDDTVIDLVGEITNMVTGSAKRMLGEKGYEFDMATPIVITGVDQKISHLAKGPVIIIPFETESGTFYVEVCFERAQ